jgi:hypothetical protein
MSLEEQLQELIAYGAGFCTRVRRAPVVPLAAAHILTTGEIWYCDLWPENEFAMNWRAFHKAETFVGGITFQSSCGTPLFTVSWLDPTEAAACQWKRWKDGQDEEARAGRALVRTLEKCVVTRSIAV